jgi:flagellar biosynthetic protein FliP
MILPRLLILIAAVCLLSTAASAQQLDLGALLPEGNASVSGRIIQIMAVVTVLSVAPGILMMVTSFTRFLIAFSFLRSGLGLQTTPNNLILVSLAMFMTLFVMGPTMEQSWQAGVKPMIDGKIAVEDGYAKITTPFRKFMLANVREKELMTFKAIATEKFDGKEKLDENDLRVLIPAFMISELRRGFEIGFLIALPFLVIDLVVATILMSMGMMMMPPTVLSLPLKVLFFVLVDGWSLLVGTLVKSFVS